MADEIADLFLSGATTTTFPNPEATFVSVSNPGAEIPSSLVKRINLSDITIF
jgi:hypothetical protein